jgi:hypothetical protein
VIRHKLYLSQVSLVEITRPLGSRRRQPGPPGIGGATA